MAEVPWPAAAAEEGLPAAYQIEADEAPVMSQERWRLRTAWDEVMQNYATEKCDMYGNVGPRASFFGAGSGSTTCSTREPTPENTPRSSTQGDHEEAMEQEGNQGPLPPLTASTAMARIGEENEEEELEEVD